MNDTNHWQFEGEVRQVNEKTTKRGKTFHELVVSQADGEYSRLAVCTFWGKLPAGTVHGAAVRVMGRVDGREYNGKHYAGLTASDIEVLYGTAPVVTADEQPSEPDTAPAAGDGEADGQGEMPF
jgi:hypothetical protein